MFQKDIGTQNGHYQDHQWTEVQTNSGMKILINHRLADGTFIYALFVFKQLLVNMVQWHYTFF